MTSERRFFSGDSLAQALNQAAQHFGVGPGELNYKLVEKRHGFLKARRKVVIEVDASAPITEQPAPPESPAASEPAASATAPAEAPSESPPPSAEPAFEPAIEPAPERAFEPTSEPTSEPTPEPALAPEPQPAAPDVAREPERIDLPATPPPVRKRFSSAEGDEARAAADALERILALAGLDLKSEILQGEEELLVELWGEDQDILLRDRGRLLLAIQHLLPRVTRGLIGHSVVCKVDSDDFHMIREERLRDMAQRAADEVRRRGRPKTLEPMSPDERRIVHLTLADYPGIETESHGSGLFKRVMVRAAADDSRPHRR